MDNGNGNGKTDGKATLPVLVREEDAAELREKAKDFAMTIIKSTPKSADQSSALRQLRAVLSTCIDAIAINEAGQKGGPSEN